jgi:hypothetical protein
LVKIHVGGKIQMIGLKASMGPKPRPSGTTTPNSQKHQVYLGWIQTLKDGHDDITQDSLPDLILESF